MMHQLNELVETASLAIARSEGILPSDLHESLQAAASTLRQRSGFFGDVLLVALAGGTGSGKSSLINALVGDDVVRTGIVRPTTDEATAVVPSHLRGSVAPHAARLGIDHQVTFDADSPVVLIDLPDFDSIEEAHRRIVSDVLPVVDAAVWVFDPEKYADPDIHRSFLASLAPYAEQFVFVLNKADTIPPADLDTMLVHLRELLVDDGLGDVDVVAASALTNTAGGVRDLRRSMDDRLDVKRTAYQKAAMDLRILADTGYRLSVSARDAADAPDAVALSAATFVSLGVQAFEVHHSVQRLG